MEPLLTPQQAAEKLKVSERTLENWRGAGTGPRYVKMGSLVRYRDIDLASFAAEKTVEE